MVQIFSLLNDLMHFRYKLCITSKIELHFLIILKFMIALAEFQFQQSASKGHSFIHSKINERTLVGSFLCSKARPHQNEEGSSTVLLQRCCCCSGQRNFYCFQSPPGGQITLGIVSLSPFVYVNGCQKKGPTNTSVKSSETFFTLNLSFSRAGHLCHIFTQVSGLLKNFLGL